MTGWKEQTEQSELFEVLPCAMVFCEKKEREDGFKEYCLYDGNPSFYECIGYEKESFPDGIIPIDKILVMAERGKFGQLTDKMQQYPEECYSEELLVMDKNGDYHPVLWNGKYTMQQGEEGVFLFGCISLENVHQKRTELINRLNESESDRKKVKNMLYELPVGVALLRGGNTYTVTEANQEFYRITGYSGSKMEERNLSFLNCIYSEDYNIFEDAVELVRMNKKPVEFEVRVLTKDHRLCCCIFQCQLYYYMDAIPYYILTGWDITKRKTLEDELRIMGERYRLLEEVTDEIPLDYDVLHHKFRVPAKYQLSLHGDEDWMVEREVVLGEIHEEDRETVRKAIEAASLREMSGTLEYRLHRKAEDDACKYVWYRTVYRSIPGQNQQIAWIIGKSYDISIDKQKQEKLSEEMHLDPLTRLYNKVAVKEEVEKFLSAEQEGTHVLFLIDIDNFKKVNDTFGHAVGDTVISDIAGLIQEQFRSTDIIGRVGGDEFVVFMKSTTLKAATEKAKQLCTNVGKSLNGDGEDVRVTLSVGLAVYGKNGNDYQALFEKADNAMYRIKDNGKNYYALADESVIPDPKQYTRLKRTDEERGGKADTQFLILACNLLSHAKDLNASLNVLLEQIGKRFRLNMVAVFELEEDRPEMLLTNCWSNIGQIYEKNVLPVTWEKFDKIESGTFIHVSELQNRNTYDLENWNLNRTKIMSMAAVKFEFSNGRMGCLDIGTIEKDTRWDADEVATLCELSHIIGVFVSLRERLREDQRAIHQLKHRDKLTGLYVLDSFKNKFEKELKNRQLQDIYALVVVDIDHFSYINENFGQAVGDSILYKMARLLETKDKYQLFSARMYSDYFVSLLKAENREQIISSIAEGNQKFEIEYKEKYPAGSISLSTGICFVEEQVAFDNVFEGANLARKYAKEQHISTGVVYETHMRQKRDDLVRVSSQFYGAIQKGEFKLYLQPKFMLGSREIYGAEALARWQTEDGRVIPPARFIPALESLGYVVDLDFCIFEQLLRTMKRWVDTGKEMITVSTNFSRKNFENGGYEFIERIKAILNKYPVPTEYIEIEVTESAVAENMECLKNCMEQLSELGFRIAIDDFGTGYSSLSVLLEVPANVIKIDKTFTDKLDQEKQRRFVSKMGLLIKATKEEVIFEGIETEEQEAFLKSSGFKYGQGYLCDKPIQVEEFEKKYM